MSIENISRIYEKNSDLIYLFEVPETFDNDAVSSYIIRNSRHINTLTKITQLKDFVADIKNYRIKKIEVNSRDYTRFLTLAKRYLEEYQYAKLMEENITDNITDEDIKAIAKQYRETLKKGKSLK